MIIKLFFIDTFANGPFSGGRAGVFLLKENLPNDVLRKLATQTGLSLMVFIVLQNNGFMCRYFNSWQEIDAEDSYGPIAAAHVLFEAGLSPVNKPLTLLSRSEASTLTKDSATGRIKQNAPVQRLAKIDKFTVAAKLGISPENLLMTGQFTGGNLVLCFKDVESLQKLDHDQIVETSKSFPITLSAPYQNNGEALYILEHHNLDPIMPIHTDINLKAHMFVAPFWSDYFKRGILQGVESAPRPAKIYSYFNPQNNQMEVSGEVITSFKADPVQILPLSGYDANNP